MITPPTRRCWLSDAGGPAVVVREEGSLSISLLGMTFLRRLTGYSIHDGVLTIEW